MGNYMRIERVGTPAMATTRPPAGMDHPTVVPERRPRSGLYHVTVVPENYDPSADDD
ncbi:Uncharacterized protein HSR121_1091 [Halapricum desulfuricans]|uniref:Uncharacterized protein n=1 Tax=Halapricum desulfuricans TaxID=2841257 RepID=A0A897MZL5_9EURY|nr:Uncharacterized protein HSR121_1091 [Halapricum desulfuricans]